MSLSSFGDNGRNRGNNKLSPNMLLLLVGIFVILPMSGLFGLLWTAVAAFLLVKQAKKQGGNGEKPSAPLSPRRESKGPALPCPYPGPLSAHIRVSPNAHPAKNSTTMSPPSAWTRPASWNSWRPSTGRACIPRRSIGRKRKRS